jgi:hypothetical protein
MAGAPTLDRHLSGPLLIGMLVAPVVFVWLFLRAGYSPSLRRAAFIYTGVTTAVVFLGRTLGGP